MLKKIILFSILALMVLVMLISILAYASYLFKDFDFKITNISCVSSYKNVTICEFDSESRLITGLYENNTIFVNRVNQNKGMTVRHEYCHYLQDMVRNESIGPIQEFECYFKSYFY